MKYFNFFFFILIFVFGASAQSDINELYLRRVSFLLTGSNPSTADLTVVKNLSSEDFEKFLSLKITTYMSTPQFSEKMRQRILSLLGIRFVSEYQQELFFESFTFPGPFKNKIPQQGFNSVLDNYIKDFIKSDRPWDHLLTGNEYRISLAENNFESEKDFFQDVADLENLKEDNSAINIFVKNKNLQSALVGVITTPRFFEKYASSHLQKNNLKARAVLQIFLCQNLDQSEADCPDCSKKIKLMADVFEHQTMRPSFEKIFSTVLFHDDISKKSIALTVTSAADLGKKITQQKQFSRCQSNKIRSWFDVESSENDALLKDDFFRKKFDSFKRSPKPFIKHILLSGFERFSISLKKNKTDFSAGKNSYLFPMNGLDFYTSLIDKFSLNLGSFKSCRLNVSDWSHLNFETFEQKEPTLNYYQVLSRCLEEVLHKASFKEKIKTSPINWTASDDKKRMTYLRSLSSEILGENLYTEEQLHFLSQRLLKAVNSYLKENKLAPDRVLNVPLFFLLLSREYIYI